MQRVLVVRDRTPLTHCAHDALCEALVRGFAAAGADAEAIAMPAPTDARASLADMLARRSLDVWNADRVIALSFPACLVKHPYKIVWLLDEPGGRSSAADFALALGLGESKRVFARNRRDARTLSQRTGCKSGVLDAPANAAEWSRVAAALLS